MKRLMLTAVLATLLAAPLAACKKPDKAALEACLTDKAALKDGDGCKACCKKAGSNGHTFSNFGKKAECKCM